MARRIEVEIVGDSSSYRRALGQAQGTTSKFGKVAKTALIGGAAAGLYALGKAAKIGWDEYSQGTKVAAQTNAVIKSTGGVANVTAQHVEDLGKALMLKSGADDEAIKSGENVLLTFRDIHNEAGRGNDIFDQATKATLDLSVALGRDMSDSAIQVGKALQDPVRGLTALRRVGVQFTDAQEKLITKLVETGRKAEAQKIILGELRAEFGGSAKAAGETLPGKLAILQERFRNFAGQMVEKVIPPLSSFVDFIDKVSTGKTVTIKIRTALAGAGTALENLLFGSPATRVKVPIEGGRFEWVVKGGGTGLVGAVGDAIRDVNWTHVGELIASGMGDAGQKAGDSLMTQFAKTVKDKIQSPSDVFGAYWTATKIELEFLPFTHVWRKVWGVIEDEASAGVAGVGISLGKMAGSMVGTATKSNTFADAYGEHMSQVSGSTSHAADMVENLRGRVASLKSKTIQVNANVSGLGYVAALQEHLSVIANQGVNVAVAHRAAGGPVASRTPYVVGERGPELFVPRSSGTIIPNGAGAGGGGSVNVIVLGGDRGAIEWLRGLDARSGRRSGRGIL